MAETINPQEGLADLVVDIQKLAQVSVIIGRNTLNCMSSDGQYLYSLSAANPEQRDLTKIDAAEISNIKHWRLKRSARSDYAGYFEMTRYNILTNDDGEYIMATSEHLVPCNIPDPDSEVSSIAGSVRLQHELGLTVPDTRDYADLDNALFDLTEHTEATIIKYEQDTLESKLPDGLAALLPFSVLDITNPN